MSTFSTIKTNIQGNLDDSSSVNFSYTDLNDAVQDAYDEVVALSQCIIKKVNLPFLANYNYYNFQDGTNFATINVPDFMACTAIFNYQTNLWLLDDKVIKDFDRERIDWENWIGNAVWWCPCNDAKRIALVPKNLTAVSNFDLYYWASAPAVVDANSPLVPPDFENLIEIYATGSLLETYEEFTKAQAYFNEFYGVTDGQQNFDKGIFDLANRSKNIAKSDLLMIA